MKRYTVCFSVEKLLLVELEMCVCLMWVYVIKLKNVFGAQLLTGLLDAWLVHKGSVGGISCLGREREKIKRYADDIKSCKCEADWWILGSSGFSLSVPANQRADICLCVVGCVTIWWLVFKVRSETQKKKKVFFALHVVYVYVFFLSFFFFFTFFLGMLVGNKFFFSCVIKSKYY